MTYGLEEKMNFDLSLYDKDIILYIFWLKHFVIIIK